MNRRFRQMMVEAMSGAGAAWTPASPTTDGGVSPHTYFDLENGLYQDSAKTTLVASDGDVVGAEVNQGSDTYDVVQDTTTQKPLYKTSILNGKPALLFDGSNDYLKGVFGGGLLSQPFTIIYVCKLNTANVDDDVSTRFFDSEDATNRVSFSKDNAGTPDNWSFYAGSGLDAGAADDNWNIFIFLVNGASSQVWINGLSAVTGNAGTRAMDGFTFGATFTGTIPWPGYGGKRLLYPGNISTADKNQVGQYLADFYGLSWTDIT